MIKNDNKIEDKIEARRTNLYIYNWDIWNWVKAKKNELDLESLSNYVFKILSIAREMDLELRIMLECLEKYFEYFHYDMNSLRSELGLSLPILVQQINEKVGQIPLFGSGSYQEKNLAKKKIHDMMISQKIIPRELSVALEIKQYIDLHVNSRTHANEIEVPDDYLLEVLFSNVDERRLEVYTFTFNLLTNFLQKVPNDINQNPFQKIKECKASDMATHCDYLRPDLMYKRLGIPINLEDIQVDFIADILKEKDEVNYLRLYGMFLEMGIEGLIGTNLKLVEEFLQNELIPFDKAVNLTGIIQVFNMIENRYNKTKKSLQDYIGIPINPILSGLSSFNQIVNEISPKSTLSFLD